MNSTKFFAGVGKADITCYESGTLDGMLSKKTKKHIPAEFLGKEIRVDDPLYVRALALDDGKQKFLLLTMDITAIGCRSISQYILNDSADDFMPKLRSRVEQELGIPGGNLAVCASHTHPPGKVLCSDQEQIEKTIDAVKQALDNIQPVNVGVNSGSESRIIFNRTIMMKDGTDFTIRTCYPFPDDAKVDKLRPVDPEIGIMRIDRLDGSPLALVYNYGCHLLIGTPEAGITADYPGIISAHLEETLGNDVMAFFIQGAGGDVAETNKSDFEHPRDNHEFAMTLAESILKAYREIKPDSGDLQIVSENIEFPLRTDIPKVVAKLQQEQNELTKTLRYTPLDFKTFLPLYLKYKLNSQFPNHSAYRYLQAEATANPRFKVMDERNRRAIDKYLESIVTMERMAFNEEQIETLKKHQEIIEELNVPMVKAEILGVKIGKALWITVPMEMLVEVAMNVKHASPFKHTYIASITNGYLHYAPPASYYPRGGYEATECLLAPEWEAIFMAAVSRIFDKLAGK